MEAAGNQQQRPRAEVGANAWGWEPWGLSFACGMALHLMDRPGLHWSHPPDEQKERERRLPENLFVQNARQADSLIDLHRLARAMPCHDRPMRYAFLSGAYGRPDNGQVQPSALWAVEAG